MKTICKMLGGSHAYGLNTSASDEDLRGVWLHSEPRYIIGLDRYEHIDKKGETDEFYWEMRHFLNLMRKTNTQALEVIFNHNWIEITPEFERIQAARFELLDSERFYKSIKGYLFNEFKLVTGIRTGLLGGKRKEDLVKYKFSPKNLVQYLRLAWAGKIFFQEGYFPVNVRGFDQPFAEYLLDIKINPQSYTLEQMEKVMLKSEENLDKSFNERKQTYKFNEQIANDICCELYKPLL